LGGLAKIGRLFALKFSVTLIGKRPACNYNVLPARAIKRGLKTIPTYIELFKGRERERVEFRKGIQTIQNF